MRIPALAALLGLAACGVAPGPPLVSAQSPPGTGALNTQSQPQPLGSLPPGAATSGSGVGQTWPNYLQGTFRI